MNVAAKSGPAHDTLQLGAIYGVLLLGLAFHAIYILSIFDIYFRSPLVRNLPATDPVLPAPAKRLVLFVGDGLRADRCFESDGEGRPRSPFLHRIVREHGVWGISHTRVPTESRPGHVAMIAGFYEDVSAVTKGWKHNPVEFDHTLRRARYAWAMGAPEIVALFPGPNVARQSYSEDMIDFAKDALELDRWSFDRLDELFRNAQQDPTLAEKLRSDQVVIFVHLLGLDTNGHAFRPHSREYLDNVSYVDRGVERAVKMIDAFFADDRTAYIFTSDHGMSDAGTHGDGDPDNTRCPLVVWGAGVGKPIRSASSSDEDWTRSWGLGHLVRRDVSQADLTPLMASLVGIPIPTNSEGIVPIDYLGGTSEHFCAQAVHRNLQQLATTLAAKETQRASREPFFRPFEHPINDISLKLDHIQHLITAKNYRGAIEASARVREEIFRGLKYYQKYDWVLLRSVISLGYVGWMLYIFVAMAMAKAKAMVSIPESSHPRAAKLVKTSFLLLTVASFMYLWTKGAPIQYHLYFAFPLFFWYATAVKACSRGPIRILSVLGADGNLLALVVYAVAMECLVFSFFHRSLLAVVIPGLAIGLLSLIKGWTFSASQQLLLPLFLAVAVFPLLNPIQQANSILLYLGVASIGGFGLVMVKRLQPEFSVLRGMLFAALLGLAAGTIYHADALFAAKLGVSQFSQQLAWIVLLLSLASPLLLARGCSTPSTRLLAIFLGLAPAYVILSISYEPLFLTAFCAPLITWTVLKDRQGKALPASTSIPDGKDNSPLDRMILFLSYKLVAYILLAFFGTGNFASISSFALPSVYRLVTRFSPFLMAALLIVKLLIPMVFLSAAYGAIVRMLSVPTTSIFLVVVGTIDLMTLSFFFLVRDHGSWLEIGTSISHFILASVFSVAALLVLVLSQVLLGGVSFGPKSPLKTY